MKSEVNVLSGNFTEVRVDATINKGNYESEKVGVTFALAEGDDVFSVINLCKDVVYGKAVFKKEEPKSKLKTEAAKEEAKTVVETVVEEAKAEEAKSEETVKEEVKKEEPKKEKAGKKVAAKAKETPYNRADESHKRLLSAFLDKAQPNWKTKEVITKASKTSQLLSEAGEDFLDGDGVLLQSFKDKFLEQLRA
jgi:outer membrane biosynthesis protein TonB